MWRILLAVILAAAPCGPLAAALLVNAGFETGDGGTPSDPLYWTEYGPDLTGECSSAFKRSGGWSAKRWTGGDYQEYGYYQDFPAIPGREYRLTAWLYSPSSDPLSGSSYACLKLEFLSPGGAMLLQRESLRLTTSNAGFEEYLVSAVAPLGATKGRVVYAVGAGSAPHGGAAYCDDVTVEDLGPLPASDDALLEELQRRAFRFFWDEAGPLGLIKDRADNFRQDRYQHSSIASVGFGLAAICVAEERGWISREQARQRITLTLDTLATKVPRQHGFFPHFLDTRTGQPSPGTEYSTIDTAILLYGALFAGSWFEDRYGDASIRQAAEALYHAVQWPVLHPGSSIYSEYWMMDLLAIGSPTYPLPPSVWDAFSRNFQDNLATRPADRSYPRFFYPVLFVHQYPQLFLDMRFRRDAHTADLTYYESTRNHTLSNRQYCIDHSVFAGFAHPRFQTYSEHCWGLTAGDGPDGYRDYGEALPWLPEPQGTWLLDGTVLPHAPGGSVAFAPEVCIPALRWMAQTYGHRIWGRYGFSDAFNVDRNWWADDVIGIDLGAIFLSIENYRSGSIWRWTMRIPAIRRALALTGFVTGRQAALEDFESAPPGVWGSGCESEWGTGFLSYEETGSKGQLPGSRVARITASTPGGGAGICLGSLDLTYTDLLVFFIRGQQGGERLTLALRDCDGREAAVPLTEEHLSQGSIGTEWQVVSVPLRAFYGIRRPCAERLAFLLQEPGSVLVDGVAFSGAHPDAPAVPLSSPGYVRSLPSGVSVALENLIVTDDFGPFFYAARPDRASGIRVQPGGGFTPGDRISIRGTVGSVDGESAVFAAEVSRQGRVIPLQPVAMSAAGIGKTGPDPLGLRVRSWGQVSGLEQDGFRLRDGSGRELAVIAPSLPKPAPGAFVIVTGVAGRRDTAQGSQPVLRIRSPWDVEVVQ
jgi:hypothetical protein